MKLLCLIFLCFLARANAKGYGLVSNGKDWNYEKTSPSGGANTIGPAKWSANYGKCNDNRQSPINVATTHVTDKKSYGNLTMNSGYSKSYNIKATNVRTTVTFVPVLNSGEKMPTVNFRGKTYRLQGIQARWGSTNYDGSEHAIDSQKFAGELQFVHYNTDFSDYAAAEGKTGGVLIWSHFLKVTSTNNVADSQTNALFNLVGYVHNSDKSSTTSSKYTLASMLPHDEPTFYQIYTYDGSLTTPPCSETVKWVINKTPIKVSTTQMNRLRALKDASISISAKVSDNNRPIQNRNSRYVYRNFQNNDLQGYCSSAVAVKPVFAAALTLVAGLFLRH